MSETKPQKRLVSKQEYQKSLFKKSVLYIFAGSVLSLGMALLLWVSLVLICDYIFIFYAPNGIRDFIVFFSFCACFSGATFWFSKKLIRKGNKIDLGNPITDHNVHLLPAQETLLRGSDLPPTVQQAELLRATQAAQETPQEEMLRATIGGQVNE